ncbi:MAG: FAD-linked oxidase C-terminal domain-containing protein [Burkholderiaceae bacterium]
MFIDVEDAGQVEAAERVNDEIVRIALSMEGTCTGEHGVGLHKMVYLRQEAGEKGVELMRRIKRALDPDDLFNPGKIFG